MEPEEVCEDSVGPGLGFSHTAGSHSLTDDVYAFHTFSDCAESDAHCLDSSQVEVYGSWLTEF